MSPPAKIVQNSLSVPVTDSYSLNIYVATEYDSKAYKTWQNSTGDLSSGTIFDTVSFGAYLMFMSMLISVYALVYVLSFSSVWRLQDKIFRLETVKRLFLNSDVNSAVLNFFNTFWQTRPQDLFTCPTALCHFALRHVNVPHCKP